MKKILIIGAGNVGAHIIHYGITQNIGAEFFLLDINQPLERSQILDLKDALLFSKYSKVRGIDFGDPIMADIDIIVITAGVNQLPGETRCDLLNKNAKILHNIAQKIPKLKSTAIVLLITNPVDILTHLAYDIFDLSTKRIFGTGTLLDSARLRWRLAEKFEVNINNIHGYVLGEHGDSEFVAWSTVNPNHSLDTQTKNKIEKSVQTAAYDIIEGKGATYFGISGATIKILNAIIHNTHEVLPVSTIYPHTENKALKNTPIGVPAIIGANGIMQIPKLNLSQDETQRLEASAEKLASLYKSCPIV